MIMQRVKNGLSPASAYDAECLDRYAIGAEVEVTIKQRRSTAHHRFYWAVLSRTVENTDRYPTAEALHKTLLAELGYVTPVYRFNGGVDMVPDSTSFSKMDQAEFKQYFDQAMDMIAQYVLPGIDPTLLLKEAA